MTAPDVVAIVLAAGGGSRMASSTNKVFLAVAGRPLLEHCLRVFERAPLVDWTLLVCADADREACTTIVERGGIRKARALVTGGQTRHESEYRALLALEDEIAAGAVGTVLIHDAARPFTPVDRVEAVAAEARRSGAAILALPAVGELLTVAPSGAIAAPQDVGDQGDELWVAQTPQAFDARLALEAHQRAAREGFVGTDTSAVVERAGTAVSVVAGHPHNIKVTTSDDLLRAEIVAAQQRHDADARRLGMLTPRA